MNSDNRHEKLSALLEERLDDPNVIRLMESRLRWLGEVVPLLKFDQTLYSNASQAADVLSQPGLSSSMYERMEGRLLLLVRQAINQLKPEGMTKKENIFCNECEREAPHSLKTIETFKESDELWDASTSHQFLLCTICDTGTYRHRVWFSEWQSPDPEDAPVFEDTYHPPRRKRSLPEWHGELSEDLQSVLEEAYMALDHDLRYVSAIACRTAIDMAIVDKIGDQGAFAVKLKKLVKDNIISEAEKELILAISDSGDAAAHRGYKPDLDALITVIEVLERLLHKFYIKAKEEEKLMEAARSIRKKVPARKKGKLSPTNQDSQ
jgi:hypothetical protein